jgi:Holliday junction DNA helicase RuvA
MFYSLSGKLIYTDTSAAVIECGGVGFKCFVSLYTLKKLPQIGSQVTVYTHLNVREDALDLFGFYDSAELELFKLITSVSGVGPKVALSILSEFDPDKLALAIAGGDSKSITRANGVGAKLAQRIVLELKDKVGGMGLGDSEEIAAVGTASASRNSAEAVEALVSLGYSQSEASLAVGRLDSSLPVEQLIKQALKNMGGRF